MAIEKVKEEVMAEFEAQTGLKAVTAWPITVNCWHVQAEDGEVYMFRWMEVR